MTYVPVDKDTVIPILVAEWAAIDELLTPLRPEQWAMPTALPGWSVQDNLAHIIGVECGLDGQPPPPLRRRRPKPSSRA